MTENERPDADDFDLPEPQGTPHPIVAYASNLERINAALRAALEQAVKTCSRCHGEGTVNEHVTDLSADETSGDVVVAGSVEVSGIVDGVNFISGSLSLLCCPKCSSWRALLTKGEPDA